MKTESKLPLQAVERLLKSNIISLVKQPCAGMTIRLAVFNQKSLMIVGPCGRVFAIVKVLTPDSPAKSSPPSMLKNLSSPAPPKPVS